MRLLLYLWDSPPSQCNMLKGSPASEMMASERKQKCIFKYSLVWLTNYLTIRSLSSGVRLATYIDHLSEEHNKRFHITKGYARAVHPENREVNKNALYACVREADGLLYFCYISNETVVTEQRSWDDEDIQFNL